MASNYYHYIDSTAMDRISHKTETNQDIINSENKLINHLINKWFWLYFFTYLSAPLRYITRVIISNSPDVSVTEFWVLYSIISLITLIYTYNDLWLTESLLYFLPKFFVRKEFNNIKTTIYLSLFIQILTGIVIALWLWFWSDWLASNYFKEEIASNILKYFCIYFIITNILQVIQTIFRSFQKTFEYQIIEFSKALFITIFTATLFFTNLWTIEWYSLARLSWIILTIIFALFLYKKFRWKIIRWALKLDKSLLKKYTKYALWALIWNWIWNLFWQIILQMVVYQLWAKSAWYYSNFLSLFSIGTTLLWPIIFLIFPLTSEHNEQSGKKWLSDLISLFYNYFSIIILSVSTIFIIFWPEISITLFWDKYYTSWILLSLAWIFLVFNLIASFNYNILSGIGKVKERVFITLVSCIITIIIAYILIKKQNIYWASLAFWISNICTWWLSFILLKKEEISISLNWRFIIKNILSFIILWLIFIFLKWYLLNNNSTRLVTASYTITSIIIFYWLIWLVNKKEIKNILPLIKNSKIMKRN